MGCGCSLLGPDETTLVGKIEGENGRFFRTYKLGNKLGEGAFGQVRMCTRIGSGQEYAVKIMDVRRNGRDSNLDPAILKDARDEAHLLSTLAGHSHIVMLYESFLEQPGLFYMVMELCSCSLMDRLCDMPKLSEVDMSTMFREMLLGIDACHQVKIIHRDIKLDNFLYGGHNNKSIKLADFGLAVKLPRRGYMKGVSGTAPYMSPEMLAEIGYDTQTDVWSLAATAYIILYGDCPYSPKEATAAAVKKAILTADPPPTWTRPEKTAKQYSQPPKRAEEFCRYLLKRNPHERPTAQQALQHKFIQLKASQFDAGTVMMDTPVAVTRSFNNKFKKHRLNPTVQRNLDEVLKRLEAAGPTLPANADEGRDRSEHHCFTEAPRIQQPTASQQLGNFKKPDKISCTALTPKKAQEMRIVRDKTKRLNTHSGVLSENFIKEEEMAVRHPDDKCNVLTPIEERPPGPFSPVLPPTPTPPALPHTIHESQKSLIVVQQALSLS